MALQKQLLTAFQQFTAAKGVNVNEQGLDTLTKLIDVMKNSEFNMVLPQALALLNGLKDELTSNAEKTRIEDLLIELNHTNLTVAEKKRRLNCLLSDKVIQECLMEQLRQHQAKTGVSDKELRGMKQPEKKSFAQKALGSFMNQCYHDVKAVGDRNALDPVGMFFNHLFAALGLMLDVMMEKMGIAVPEPKEVEPTVFAPENNLTSPYYLKP